MKRFILFLLVGALLLLPLSGCLADNKQDEGTTPNNTTPETTTPEETTHDIIYPDPPEPRYAMSAQAPTEWEIANGDIPISLSFGLKEYCSVDDMFSNIVIYLVNSEDQTHVFKKIDIAEIEKPEYVVEYVYDEERQVVGFNYAHTETVNLPLSLFSEDSGFVQILMRDWVDDGTDEGQYGAGGGTILYYKRNGETTLIISDKPIQESTTPDNPPEVTTPPENNQNNPTTATGEELDKSSDLIVALLAFWKELNEDILWSSVSFSSKIDAIKDGAQALHVVFDVNNYYFVCAYNSPDNEKIYYEDCMWVKYDDETDIQEYYNGEKLAKAFQINKALSVIDILSGDTSVPNVEHFQTYNPMFENGVNIATPIVVNGTFICVNGSRYLNVPNDKTIYHYWGNRFNKVTIDCVRLENQDYLSFHEYIIYKDGHYSSEVNYTYHLEEYYDILINAVEKEKYSVTTDKGNTIFYGVISIEDFVNGVLK